MTADTTDLILMTSQANTHQVTLMVSSTKPGGKLMLYY